MSLANKQKVLREQRGKLEAKSKKIIETAEVESCDISNEENARIKTIHEVDAKLGNRIKNINSSLSNRETWMSWAPNHSITTEPLVT